jgi:putative oxidoreductase
MKKNIDLGILISRISLGTLMLLHGSAKLLSGLDFIKGMLAHAGLPSFIAYGVILGEVIAPALILIGFRTRIGAALYAINCIFAILLGHSADLFTINQFGGWTVELLGLYLLGSTALFFTGAGRYSLSSTNNWD